MSVHAENLRCASIPINHMRPAEPGLTTRTIYLGRRLVGRRWKIPCQCLERFRDLNTQLVALFDDIEPTDVKCVFKKAAVGASDKGGVMIGIKNLRISKSLRTRDLDNASVPQAKQLI